MKDRSMDRLTVLGGGVLGGQIAWHSAFRGKKVVVYDLYDESLDGCRMAHDRYADIYQTDLGAKAGDIAGTRDRLTYTSDLAAAVREAEVVIEAVPEIPDVKTDVYRKMAPLLAADTIVTTNSSTLLPRQFAEATGRPEKYCALHFANLIWSMNLAEVMAHPTTSAETLAAVTRFAIEIGMVPIPVQKEQNGCVLNSWFVPFLNAAQTLVTNGVSTPEYIDRTYLICNRGASYGPCALIDIVGMKTAFDVLAYWGEENDDEQMRKNARYIKENFLDHGLLGLQTGQGYYTYPNPAFAAPGFLDVPDVSKVPELVGLVVSR